MRKHSFKLLFFNALYLSCLAIYGCLVSMVSHWSLIHQSNSFKTTLERRGLKMPPYGVPLFGKPSLMISAFNKLEMIESNFLSLIPMFHSCFRSFP